MASSARLIGTNKTQGIDPALDECTILRHANNSIPLLWWALFDPSEQIEYEIPILSSDGRDSRVNVVSWLANKNDVLDCLGGIIPKLTLPWKILSESLHAQIGKLKELHVQLECSELQLLMGAEAFDEWVRLGSAYGVTLRNEPVFRPFSIPEDLMDLCGLFPDETSGLESQDLEFSLIGSSWGD